MSDQSCIKKSNVKYLGMEGVQLMSASKKSCRLAQIIQFKLGYNIQLEVLTLKLIQYNSLTTTIVLKTTITFEKL
jgi:hypothetical protein